MPNYHKTAKAWRADAAKMALLENTKSPDEIDSADYDAIYFTGGHAAVYDFPDGQGLQRITREIFERGDVVDSVCHGYCGLLNTKLSDGTYLIAGKKMNGFAWQEEGLARVDRLVPYNAEERAKERGALYEKDKPLFSYAVIDGKEGDLARAEAQRAAPVGVRRGVGRGQGLKPAGAATHFLHHRAGRRHRHPGHAVHDAPHGSTHHCATTWPALTSTAMPPTPSPPTSPG